MKGPAGDAVPRAPVVPRDTAAVPLKLRARDAQALSADLTDITPEGLAAAGARGVGHLVASADGVPVPLGDLVSFSGSANDAEIEYEGDFSRFHGIGSGMSRGSIMVHGDVGGFAGARMSGGVLVIDGTAGPWLGAGLSGGTIHVRGDVGDDAAAALPGESLGLTGGTVIVDGAAGDRVGCRMRRGIVAVGGDCGEGAGLELRAGSVVVAGRLGPDAGLGMRRGSVIAAGTAGDPGPNFLRGALWSPTVLRLLARRLEELRFAPALAADGAFLAGPWRQWHGDSLTGGRGELLTREVG